MELRKDWLGQGIPLCKTKRKAKHTRWLLKVRQTVQMVETVKDINLSKPNSAPWLEYSTETLSTKSIIEYKDCGKIRR